MKRSALGLAAGAIVGLAALPAAVIATPASAADYNAAAASRPAPSPSWPSQITIKRQMNFNNAPVQGYTGLTLLDNGKYLWTGSALNTGSSNYDFAGVCVVRMSSGAAFVFETSERLGGKASKYYHHTWNKYGIISSLPAAWRASSGDYTWRCQNTVNFRYSTVDSMIKAVGPVSSIVRIVA